MNRLVLRHLLDVDNFYLNFTDFNFDFYLNYTDFDFGDNKQQLLCGSFHKYLQFLHTYYVPLIIGIGFIGNILSTIVFLTTHLKMRSSSYYLAALSITDFTFLFIVLIVNFSFNKVFNIFNTNGWCQFFVYTSSVCSLLSVWLIVAFTIERFIAIQYPLQRPHICTVTRAKFIVFGLIFFATTSQLYIFWIAGMIKLNDGNIVCEMIPNYHEFMKIMNFIDTLITLILPFILIVSMNAMIAYNLFLFGKKIQAEPFNDYAYDKNQIELQHSINTQSGSSKRQSSQNSQNSQKSNRSKSNKKDTIQLERWTCSHDKATSRNIISARNQQNITKMLLLISSVFIALNFPSYVTRLLTYFAFKLQERAMPETLWCIQQFAMLLFYTNFSVNFLLYAMCGVTFRRCLYQLLRNKFKLIFGVSN